MKRNYLIDEPIPLRHKELVLQTAFHEAGHATAIYLCNRQKQLPPVHFQITLGGLYGTTNTNQVLALDACSQSNWIATVEGGHLIHSLPVSVIENNCYFSDHESTGYQQACEADIINLLAGPLAEAKYVAERDDELINARLINVNSLKFYGGTSDLEKVDDYLDGLITSKNKIKRHEKINELFLAAFQFINEPAHWLAVTDLAHFILNNDKNIISCEEAIMVIDNSIASANQSRILHQGFAY